MSLLGKLLVVLNLAALLGFVYCAVKDYEMRQRWAYAMMRWDIALDGLPVDDNHTDARGRPRKLDLNEKLCTELVGNANITTQQEFLNARKEELLVKVNNDAVKGTKIDKLTDILLRLTPTLTERELLLEQKRKPPPGHEENLKKRIEDHFKEVIDPAPGVVSAQTRDGEDITDQDRKRLGIARTLVALADVLPTEEEKTTRAAPTYDPLASNDYKRTVNAVGVRMATRALEMQAEDLLKMSVAAADQRTQERFLFAFHHQTLVDLLLEREHQLLEQRDKLAVTLRQRDEAKAEAEKQSQLAVKRKDDLEQERTKTANLLADLQKELDELFKVRVLLRDANRNNQLMEEQIRAAEQRLTTEQP